MIQYRERRLGAASVLGVGVVVTTLLLFVVSGPAQAVPDFEATIPLSTVVRAPEGSLTELAVLEVGEEFQGQECSATAHTENQDSVHPNNDLLVTSGSSEVVVPDVEAESYGTVDGVGTLTLGSTIVVSLRMGSDEVFSAGFEVTIECPPKETTTTTEQETTTSEERSTTTTDDDDEDKATTTTQESTTTTDDKATTTTQESTTTSIETEVLDTEITVGDELPFTGSDGEHLGWLALIIVTSGLFFVVAVYRPQGE